MDDPEALHGQAAALRAVLQFQVGEICKHTGGKPCSGPAVSTLTEVVFKYFKVLADDLRAFAKHGRRATITADDVLLVARKDPNLVRALEDYRTQHLSAGKKPAKRPSKKQSPSPPSSDLPAHIQVPPQGSDHSKFTMALNIEDDDDEDDMDAPPPEEEDDDLLL